MIEPSITVLANDEPTVEVAVFVDDVLDSLVESIPNIKDYMLKRRCRVALLVNHDITIVLRDAFTAMDTSSIVEEGRLETRALLGERYREGGDQTALRVALMAWLEELSRNWPDALPSATDARSLVADALVPSVVEGRVMSGSLG